LLVAASLVVGGLACSSGQAPVPPEDQESGTATAYARATKKAVKRFVDSAKESPKAVKGQAQDLLEKLQAHTSQPVGGNKAIYEELTAKCKEIVSASPADVNKKLDEMTALANKLSD
jgi:hypothetical protein